MKHQVHLKNVPDYIIPETLRNMAGIATNRKRKWNNSSNAAATATGNNNRKRGNKNNSFKPKTTETQKRFNKRKADPLDMGLAKRKR